MWPQLKLPCSYLFLPRCPLITSLPFSQSFLIRLPKSLKPLSLFHTSRYALLSPCAVTQLNLFPVLYLYSCHFSISPVPNVPSALLIFSLSPLPLPITLSLFLLHCFSPSFFFFFFCQNEKLTLNIFICFWMNRFHKLSEGYQGLTDKFPVMIFLLSSAPLLRLWLTSIFFFFSPPEDRLPPSVVVNKGLVLDENSMKKLTTLQLSASDQDSEPGELVYRITKQTALGHLEHAANPGRRGRSRTSQVVLQSHICECDI